MVLKEDSELKQTNVTLLKSDIEYLKGKMINRSLFLRKAIQAHREGKWE